MKEIKNRIHTTNKSSFVRKKKIKYKIKSRIIYMNINRLSDINKVSLDH